MQLNIQGMHHDVSRKVSENLYGAFTKSLPLVQAMPTQAPRHRVSTDIPVVGWSGRVASQNDSSFDGSRCDRTMSYSSASHAKPVNQVSRSIQACWPAVEKKKQKG